MSQKRLTILCLAVLLLVATLTAGKAKTAHYMPAKVDRLAHYRVALNTIRADKCLPRKVYRWKVWQVPKGILSYVILQTKTWIFDARDASSRCEGAFAWRWHYGDAASCVRSKEGGLNSVNPAGPYYGWYQTDPNFQAAYGPEFYRRWGPGIWTATPQVITAYRGWKARGWHPWPSTARACGLL